MNRREFLAQATSAIGASFIRDEQLSLTSCTIVVAASATARERKAASVLAEEVEKRSTLQWPIQKGGVPSNTFAIYVGTAASLKELGHGDEVLPPEGYAIREGTDSNGAWISVMGAEDTSVLFGVGKLLRGMAFGMEKASVDVRRLHTSSAPKYRLRGHQLGYRPKTNAYDAWNVPMWDQYIRELALLGTNAIELVPPRSDDASSSPHFPLPPERMMTEMSRIGDSYGMQVWIWYPAMDADYRDPKTVDLALQEWAKVFKSLPRVDAVFVPGGDPGETAPRQLLNLIEKQKQNLRRFHPRAQMWMSPQSFHQEWLEEFFTVAAEKHTQTWLDGVVYGPQMRMNLPEFRQRLPEHYPIRLYPDITHSLECQYPVPDWDVAYAMTEGREVINPRPTQEANILRVTAPGSIGFITYSEGCNDDVNKFIWSQLGWSPEMPVIDALREFSRQFGIKSHVEGWAQGLLNLESNWVGALATNASVATTLAKFQDMERSAPPALLQNWRFQQSLYRAYYDAFLRARLLDERAHLEQALGILGKLRDFGWASLPSDIDDPERIAPAHLLNPDVFLEEAERVLAAAVISPAGRDLRDRVRQLGEALFQSIRMQLAMERYRAEAVSRAANLDTLDNTVSDVGWLRARIIEIRQLQGAGKQVKAVDTLLRRTDPGPGGFYDQLGDPSNRPHLLRPLTPEADPGFRVNPMTGFDYPDEQGDHAPLAWKCWAEALFDAPLQMRYTGLYSDARYRLRVVYSGDEIKKKMRLEANGKFEIHPLAVRPWPPTPQEFDVPHEATAGGELLLSWTQEAGRGGNGRGCQVAEVWLMLKPDAVGHLPDF